MKSIGHCLFLLLLAGASLAGREFIGSLELRKVTEPIDKAVDEYASELGKLAQRFKQIIENDSLAWEGQDDKSKRAALTQVLKDYKTSLGKFNRTIDSLASEHKDRREGKRQNVAAEMSRGISSIEDAQRALVETIEAEKKKYIKQGKSELTKTIWALGGQGDEIVRMSSRQIASRNKFLDSFSDNIKTFFSLYSGRMKATAKSFEKEGSNADI